VQFDVLEEQEEQADEQMQTYRFQVCIIDLAFPVYFFLAFPSPLSVLGQVATPQVATVEIASGYFGSGLLDLSNGGGYCGCGYSVSVNSQPH